MVAIKMDDLFKEYTQLRKLRMNKEQFIYLVNLYPALLVVLSDGLVDTSEWAEVRRLSEKLGIRFADGSIHGNDELGNIYKAEFKFLLENRADWEMKFLNALKDYFNENENAKDFVLEIMFLFAKASKGISNEEADTIEFLTKVLLLKTA